MHSKIITHINKYVALNEEETLILLKYVKQIKVKKKEYLLREGQTCRSQLFVQEGCLRMFFISGKGMEQTTHFAMEGWWLADYMSLDTRTPSSFYIQAIENSELLSIDHDAQNRLLEEVPRLEKYFRMIMQKAYAAAQLRIKYLYDFSKEEGYRHFLSKFPEFAGRVPQYMLASYLGLTPEYMSEIRRKKS